VVEAAEAALAEQGYVSAIDVLTCMGLLALAHVDDWRRGRLPYLEPAIQGSFEKISRTKTLFLEWARNHNLKPSQTAYLARTTGPGRVLQFSESGDPATELFYRTHYVSPALSEKKQEKLREKLSIANGTHCQPRRSPFILMGRCYPKMREEGYGVSQSRVLWPRPAVSQLKG